MSDVENKLELVCELMTDNFEHGKVSVLFPLWTMRTATGFGLWKSMFPVVF